MPTEKRYTGVEPHGTGWRGVYRVSGLRHRTHTYPTKREAFEARSLALVEARQGLHVDRRRSGITVDQWFTVWQPGRRVRQTTREHDAGRWANHISPYLGALRLDGLTPFQVDKWVGWMGANGRNPATQRHAFVLLKTALGRAGAVGDRRIAVNPCDAVRPPRHRSPERVQLTREQFEAILGNIEGERDRAVALVAAYAGLRWSEMAGLRRSDYNPLRGTLNVSKGLVAVKGGLVEGATKSNATRELPVHPRLKAALDALSVGKGRDDLLFASRTGGPLHAANYRNRVWLPATTAAGVEATFHTLRHAFASWLLEGGADLEQVRDLLGHASIVTTQIYLHANEDKKREAVFRALG